MRVRSRFSVNGGGAGGGYKGSDEEAVAGTEAPATWTAASYWASGKSRCRLSYRYYEKLAVAYG
jgi:hypothetical protein